ncbi:MAG TPA: hypothetical protein VEX86_12780 [Longimicrobium sp.]|nr:hypothetical protein [Longimicrobium sp.]
MRILRAIVLISLPLLAVRTPVHAQRAASTADDGAKRRAVQLAAVRAVMRQPHRDTLAATCVSLAGPAGTTRRVEPDSAFLAALQAPGHGPVVPLGRCPPTYEIGERVGPNPPPRPPGALDPYHVAIRRLTLLRGGRARVQVWEDRGAGTTRYACTATPAAGTWSATCRVTYIAIF